MIRDIEASLRHLARRHRRGEADPDGAARLVHRDGLPLLTSCPTATGTWPIPPTSSSRPEARRDRRGGSPPPPRLLRRHRDEQLRPEVRRHLRRPELRPSGRLPRRGYILYAHTLLQRACGRADERVGARHLPCDREKANASIWRLGGRASRAGRREALAGGRRSPAGAVLERL